MKPDRNFVYAFLSPHASTYVVNYSGSPEANAFLHHFDVWGSRGQQKMCSDSQHSAFWFECSKDFYVMLHTEEFTRAFRSMGVVLTFNDKDIIHIE